MDPRFAGQWLTATAARSGITTYQALAVHLSVEMGQPIAASTVYRWWVGDRLMPRAYWLPVSRVLGVSIDEVALSGSGFEIVTEEGEQ